MSSPWNRAKLSIRNSVLDTTWPNPSDTPLRYLQRRRHLPWEKIPSASCPFQQWTEVVRSYPLPTAQSPGNEQGRTRNKRRPTARTKTMAPLVNQQLPALWYMNVISNILIAAAATVGRNHRGHVTFFSYPCGQWDCPGKPFSVLSEGPLGCPPVGILWDLWRLRGHCEQMVITGWPVPCLTDCFCFFPDFQACQASKVTVYNRTKMVSAVCAGSLGAAGSLSLLKAGVKNKSEKKRPTPL